MGAHWLVAVSGSKDEGRAAVGYLWLPTNRNKVTRSLPQCLLSPWEESSEHLVYKIVLLYRTGPYGLLDIPVWEVSVQTCAKVAAVVRVAAMQALSSWRAVWESAQSDHKEHLWG